MPRQIEVETNGKITRELNCYEKTRGESAVTYPALRLTNIRQKILRVGYVKVPDIMADTLLPLEIICKQRRNFLVSSLQCCHTRCTEF